jgi:tRNA threonylcarbamoyladenosine biosynthesis protein TsaB
MSLILNIETSSEICSVGLSDNNELLSLKESQEPNSHSRLLTVLIDNIFSEINIKISDLDAVAVSKGPGSYTGLRIGVSVAKGICYSLNKPLIAIDTLQSLAINIFENSQYYLKAGNPENILICPLIDARRMEVYTGLYDIKFKIKKKVSADIIDTESFKDILSGNIVLFGGTGAEKCKKILSHSNAIFIDNINASAKYISKLSYLSFENEEFENTAYFEPFYLKEFIAGKPKGKPGI